MDHTSMTQLATASHRHLTYEGEQRHSQRLTKACGLAAVAVALLVMMGWLTDLSWLRTILPDTSPMVPATAITIAMCGLMLAGFGHTRPRTQRPDPILLPILVVAAIVLGRFLAPTATDNAPDRGLSAWQFLFPDQGQMSAPTLLGLAVFLTGFLALRWYNGLGTQRLARGTASALVLIGTISLVGYWIQAPQLFESQWLATGFTWFSATTATAMLLLGIGLWAMAEQLDQRAARLVTATHLQAQRVYLTVAATVVLTALTITVLSINHLESSTIKEAEKTMLQTLRAKESHLLTLLKNHTQQAELVASSRRVEAALKTAPGPFDASADQAFDSVMSRLGIDGAAIERNGERTVVYGDLPPRTSDRFPLKLDRQAALIWNQGYFLESRIALGRFDTEEQGQLILLQSIPGIGRLIDEANDWGETGTLPMCTRLGPQRLMCFPQREQAGLYEIDDTINGAPIPMTRALAGEESVEILTDYRNKKVLAAYGPVGSTGLGLVLKMDLHEVLTPVRAELALLVPSLLGFITLAIVLVRFRVRPLVEELVKSHHRERKAHRRFEAAMESSPDVFVIYDAVRNGRGEIVDYRSAYANGNAKRVLDTTGTDPSDHPCMELMPGQAGLVESYRKVQESGQPRTNECSWTDPSGQTHWFERQVVPMSRGVAVTFRDVTEERNLLHRLEESNQLRSAIVESAGYAIVSTDLDGHIQTFNRTAERMLWYKAGELINEASLDVLHDTQELRERAATLSHELHTPVSADADALTAKARLRGRDDHEWTLVRKDGSRFPARLAITALMDEYDRPKGYLVVASDITEQKRADDYIRHIALHDVLTGLPNRALLDDRLAMAIEVNHRNDVPFAVAMMDIDRFKTINDSMGHHIGDKIIQGFAERVGQSLRQTDTLARMGGDEFVLVLADTDRAGAELVARRIKESLVAAIPTELRELHVTSSIGISLCPDHGADTHELLRCADVALYWVKEHGRNGYKTYDASMDHGASERLNIERDLHKALEGDGFELFYQPKMNLRTHEVVGFEALLRMKDGHGGHITPDQFIPLAEETGLIVPIGQWVLDTACREAVALQEELGRPIAIAVNVSPRQFVNGDLVEQVQKTLTRTGLEPRCLELEITEGVLIDERDGVHAALNELDMLGVKVTIDDFGTGYSSLSYLKRYPISQIKIDKSFIHDLGVSSNDASLIEAIINMARSLNLPVVAEGIETRGQLETLTTRNCTHGQGFLIARPMPKAEVESWLARHGTPATSP